MVKQDISALLDNPTELLQRLYDLTFNDLPEAIECLRNARLNKTDANLKYDEEYRKAQLSIQKLALDKGEKLTVAERELKAKDAAAESQTAQETAEVISASAADYVFLLKDQKDTLNTLVMWKMAEMKFTPSMERPTSPTTENIKGSVPSWAKDADGTPPDLDF